MAHLPRIENSTTRPLSRIERLAVDLENLMMTRMVPVDHPGPAFKWLFKIPVLFFKRGIPLFGDFILLLTAWMAETIRINPQSAKMFSRRAGKPVGIDAPDSLLHAARFFPTFRLRPLN